MLHSLSGAMDVGGRMPEQCEPHMKGPALWQQPALLAKLQAFYSDTYFACKGGGKPDDLDSVSRQRCLLQRRARAERIASGHVEIGSMHHSNDDASDGTEGMRQMRTPCLAAALLFHDRDQFVHFCIFEWDLNYSPRGIVLYAGFPKDRGTNWDGGGRDWLEYAVGQLLDVRWVRWMKLEQRSINEFRQFPIGQRALDDPSLDLINYSWIRCANQISENTKRNVCTADWASWNTFSNLRCEYFTGMRQYIAVGAVLRVMRKAQCLNSHEYKLLRLREDEHIYMSINPASKVLIFSQNWNERTTNVPIEFARQTIADISELTIPIVTDDSGPSRLAIRVVIADPGVTIEGLQHIYAQIKIQLQQKYKAQHGQSLPEYTVNTAVNPPRPSLCWFRADVTNPDKVNLGDTELAAIAECFASLRINLEKSIMERYRTATYNRKE